MPEREVVTTAYGGVPGILLRQGDVHDFTIDEAKRGEAMGALVEPGKAPKPAEAEAEVTAAPVTLADVVGSDLAPEPDEVDFSKVGAAELVEHLSAHPEDLDAIEAAEHDRVKPRTTVLDAIESLRSAQEG